MGRSEPLRCDGARGKMASTMARWHAVWIIWSHMISPVTSCWIGPSSEMGATLTDTSNCCRSRPMLRHHKMIGGVALQKPSTS